MKLFITGISGFIGGSVGHYAVRAGHEVRGAVRLPAGDLAQLIDEFQPNVVLNAAGTASVGASIENPLDDFAGSVQTCADVLDAVRRSGARPLVVLASSAAVYGNPASMPVAEDTSLQPISPYGFHKVACELLAREYAECFGLQIMICRFFSVYGREQQRLLVWELYRQLAGKEKTAWLGGTGEETRDFLYIDDLAAAILGLSEKLDSSQREPLVVNVASGTETGVLTLAQMIRDLVAPDKEIRCRGELRKNDPLRWRADITRLQSLLPSWQPRALAAGLAQCITDWRDADWISLEDGS